MSEWKTVRLGELGADVSAAFATGPFGSAVSAKNFRPQGVPMLRGSNLSDKVERRLEDEDIVFVSEELARQFPRSVVRRGDLIFTSWGTVGQVGLIDARSRFERYLVSNKQMKMTPDPRLVDSQFLYYNLSQPLMIDLVRGQSIGSSVPGFNLGQLKALPVSLPDLKCQQSIAEVLGALDDKILANNRVATNARKLARALYTRAIADAETVRMSEVLLPILGGTPSRSDKSLWDGSVPWVSAKDVTGASHGVIIETVEGISATAGRTKRLNALPAESVVLTARGTVGGVARLGIAAAINQSCYAFIPGYIPAACLVFVVEDASAQAKAMAHGSVFDTITMHTFEHVDIPALASDQWNAIEASLAPLLATAKEAVTESARLTATRDGLLPLLMSGSLRVKDAEKTVEGVL